MVQRIEVHEDHDRHGGYVLKVEGQVFRSLAEVEAAFPVAKIVIHHNLSLTFPRTKKTACDVDPPI